MNSKIAKGISILLHPLVVPTYLFALLLWVFPDEAQFGFLNGGTKWSVEILVFLNTFLAPALVILYLKRAGYVKSLEMEDPADRRLPYVVTVFIYSLATYMLGWNLDPISSLSSTLAVVLGVITLAIALVAFINLIWKISAHTTAVAGVIGFLIVLQVKYESAELMPWLLLSILALGLVGAARLRLNAHSPQQAIAGALLGFQISLVAAWLYL